MYPPTSTDPTANSHILVLGGTGLTGICLLRELLFRNHSTVVYARTPSKIPADLESNPLLKVIKGEMNDNDKLSTAVKDSSVIISLLGPDITDRSLNPAIFSDFYKNCLFPQMRYHKVRRIFATGTLSIKRPEDSWSTIRFLMVSLMPLFANSVYHSVLNIAETFEKDAQGLDWTVYRIAALTGEANEVNWLEDRSTGKDFVGYIGEKGWSLTQKRGALARWLVDSAEKGSKEWIGKFPAVCAGTLAQEA